MGVRTDAQPARQGTLCLADPVCAQTPGRESSRKGEISSPEIDHVGKRCLEKKIDGLIRCLEAKLASAGLVQEPPAALLFDLVGERQLDDSATASERVGIDASLECPQQQPKIDLVLRQLAARPLLAPKSKREDDRREILAGWCQVVRPSPRAR
jgi:hypothetical protein